MTIRKGVITFTFMFDDRFHSVDDVNAMDIRDIIEACTDGDMLGKEKWGDYNIVEVPNENVAAEEIALDCDGTFFADKDELEHDRLDEEERPDRDCDPECTRRLHPYAECDCSRSE